MIDHLHSSGAEKILPCQNSDGLTRSIAALDHEGKPIVVSAIEEKALTIFLNSTEIVTVMTIRDYPRELAVGYLINQDIIDEGDTIDLIDYDEELGAVVVRTTSQTNYEHKLRKKVQTSGCSVGTLYGDIMKKIEGLQLSNAPVPVSWLYALSKEINTLPTLYLKAGAIHGCVLCARNTVEVYMEDIGRHNAVDKIAGYMFFHKICGSEKIFYTTGRLTSEMIVKAALMGIPVVVSRSGFTAWAVDIARSVGMTLIARLRGKRFVCVSGESNLIFDDNTL
jgi:FdhD protein